MTYIIKKYSFDRAKEFGVDIKQSTSKNKKIDVFNKNGVKIATVGDSRYKDYPTYLIEDKDVAEKRRILYKIRHKNDLSNVNSNGYWANILLW